MMVVMDSSTFLQFLFNSVDFRNLPFGQPLIDNGMKTRKRPLYVSQFFSFSIVEVCFEI